MAVLVTLLSTRPAGAVFVPPKKTSVTPSTECVGGFPSSCEKLAVDGVITALEYVDSASAPLQDFASGNPMVHTSFEPSGRVRNVIYLTRDGRPFLG